MANNSMARFDQRALEALEMLKNVGNPTINIDEFARGFWGAFTNRLETDEQREKCLAYWVRHVAGNPNTPVDVIEANGDVIASVPGIMSMSSSETLIDIYEKLAAAKKESMLDIPEIRETRMEATVSDLLKHYHSSYILDYVEDWSKLYQRIEGEVPDTLDPLRVETEEVPQLDDHVWE